MHLTRMRHHRNLIRLCESSNLARLTDSADAVRVELDVVERIRFQQIAEAKDCKLMLAASNWHTAVSFQLLVSTRVIGINRLLQPAKVKWLQQWQHALCIVERPAHIGVGHHIDAVAYYLANRSQQLNVALHPLCAICWSPAES